MAFTMTATMTRTELSLSDLDLNDHSKFIVVGLDPGELKWNRSEAVSPFYDGAVTVHRNRVRPNMRVVVDVIGATQTEIHDNMRELVAAFQQTEFTLTMVFGGQTWVWTGESADTTTQWDENARLRERHMQIHFEFPSDLTTEPLL